MRILVIEDDEASKQELIDSLESVFVASITFASKFQEGIELLDEKESAFDLIVCDYHGSSSALLICLIILAKKIPCVLLTATDKKLWEIVKSEYPLVEITDRQKLKKNLLKALDQFKERGCFPPTEDPVLKNIEDQNTKLTQMIEAKKADPVKAQEVVASSLEVIQDLTAKSGFDESAQQLAKKSVTLTLKVVGNNPKLSSIIERLKVDEGKYITSHSLMLAEVACAIAYSVGWESSGTFFKLTLASFLHDLALTDNVLARQKDLEFVKANFTPDQYHQYRFHTVKAAEYAKQIHEIPADIDTIILQHHERPDGSGFPRGLNHSRIAPLACVFIIAHDFLDYFLSNRNASNLKTFLKGNVLSYTQGTFKKIVQSLETGKPIKS